MAKLNFKNGCIEMAHGSGGKATAQLVAELFQPSFAMSAQLADDAAVLPFTAKRLVTSCDMHVVSPLFFPGGNIGDLAINGTVNDVAMMGAQPLYLTASFILEEGLPLSTLRTVVSTMAASAQKAGVSIVAGDTKVVEKGACDSLFIATTGIGVLADNIAISGSYAQAGDKIIISGQIGNHGIAILSQRENLSFASDVQSDTRALNHVVQRLLAYAEHIHCLRDPTRGGVATALNEIAQQSHCAMRIFEQDLPFAVSVQAACELMGLEPLYIANEGIFLAIVAPSAAEAVLTTLRAYPDGRHAAVIGEVLAARYPVVETETAFGGRRILDALTGDLLPRIC